MQIPQCKILILLFILSMLSACGGSGGSVGSSEDKRLSGVFVDSVVAGLTYSTATLSGVTDANGVFRYAAGETVTFSIGGIIIGSALGASSITPLDLVSSAASVSDEQVLNIARFLQTLDDNGDPEDGITISAAVSAAAISLSVDFTLSLDNFANDSDLLTVLSELTTLTSAGPRNLVTAAAARAHLQDSLFDLSNTQPTVGTLALSGPDVELVGSRLTAQDIVYGDEDFTGVEKSIVLAGRGLEVSDLESPDSAFRDGFVLIAVDAVVNVGSALIIQVDGVGYTYGCTVDCNVVIDYDIRQILFNDALFINEETASELVVSGAVDWTSDDEVSDNDGGSVGGGAEGICDPNTATLVSQQANNAYGFTVNAEACLGMLNPNTEKREIPINVVGAISGLNFDNNAKLARSSWSFSNAGTNFTFVDWYLTLDVTNNSTELLCDGVDDAFVMDNSAQQVVKINMRTKGNLIYLPRHKDDCIKPGQTLTLYGTGIQQLTGGALPVSLASLNEVIMGSEFEAETAGTVVELGALQANYFEWKYFGSNIGIEASFTNTRDTAIELEDDTFRVNYFDADGYLVSREFINRYDALGLDDNSDLEPADLIIPAGITFTLADDVADIGYAELDPGSAVKAVVYLEWSPMEP